MAEPLEENIFFAHLFQEFSSSYNVQTQMTNENKIPVLLKKTHKVLGKLLQDQEVLANLPSL